MRSQIPALGVSKHTIARWRTRRLVHTVPLPHGARVELQAPVAPQPAATGLAPLRADDDVVTMNHAQPTD